MPNFFTKNAIFSILSSLILLLDNPSFAFGQVIFLNTTTIPSVKFDPPELGEFRLGDERTLEVLLWIDNETVWGGDVQIDCEYSVGCPMVQNISGLAEWVQLDQSTNFSHLINLSLIGSFVGLNRIRMTAGKKSFEYTVRIWKSELESLVTDLFIKALMIAILSGNFLAGMQVNFGQITTNCLQKCCFILAAIICQFLINPIIGFLLAKYLLADHFYVIRLSLFLVSCTPAGVGKSNFWTVIFGGDLTLAGLLTLVQRIGTIMFTPFWIHFFARQFFVHRVKITTLALAKSLTSMFVPFLVGMFVACCGGREILQKFKTIMKVFFCLATLCFVALAILANSFLLWPLLSDPLLLLCILFIFPVLCHLLALITSVLLHMPSGARVTLVVENGVPNAGLAMMMLLLSLDEPERDVAMMAPIGLALMAEKPMLLLCLVQICHRTLFKRNVQEIQPANNINSMAMISSSMAQVTSSSVGMIRRELERTREITEMTKMDRAI